MQSPIEEKDVSHLSNSIGFFFKLIKTLLVVNNRKIKENKILLIHVTKTNNGITNCR